MGKAYPELKTIAERWIDDAIDVKASALRPCYHYTDAAGLAGMLGSHTIWLTDYRFLNDRSEIDHTRSLVHDILVEREAAPASPNAASLYRSIREWMAKDESARSFVFSLSSNKDDLSQWRGYARDGVGFTIEFDSAALYRSGRETACLFAPVAYNKQEQERALVEALQDFETVIADCKIKDRRALSSFINHAALMFDWVVENRGPFNKHASFLREEEWRMVLYVKAAEPTIKVRVSGARLVPYVEVTPRDDRAKLPIRSIGIGPGFETPDIKFAVETLLQRCGYDGVETYAADTPYRRL